MMEYPVCYDKYHAFKGALIFMNLLILQGFNFRFELRKRDSIGRILKNLKYDCLFLIMKK